MVAISMGTCIMVLMDSNERGWTPPLPVVPIQQLYQKTTPMPILLDGFYQTCIMVILNQTTKALK
jgi:hypothetical protein